MDESNIQDNAVFSLDPFEIAHQLVEEPDTDPPLPQDFGPYHFLSRIGSGSLGVVWLAEERGAERRVAIKILRSSTRPDLAANEVKIQAQLEHKYIARLYNYDLAAGEDRWLAMEYVDGLPLTDYCREHKCSIDQRLQIFHAICEGVRYAHVERAIDHGDLKPSNILVNQNGEPKLIDFGLSRRLSQADDFGEHPVLGFTPAYAAPEIVRGRNSKFRSDVYSLGVILYELLCGEQPFDASSRSFLDIEAVKFGDRPPEEPSEVAKSRDQPTPMKLAASKARWHDLDALCLKAMACDTEKRYSTVDGLLSDVDRYFRREPLLARIPHTQSYRCARFFERNRLASLVTLAVFLFIGGLVTFFTLRMKDERDKALAEAARARRIQQFMLSFLGDGSAPPQDLTVLKALDRSTERLATLHDDPETQAEIYYTLGGAYGELNQLDKTDKVLHLGLDKAKSLGDPNRQSAELLIQLALLRGDQANYPDAQRTIDRALNELERLHLRPDDPLSSKAKVALGKILIQEGSYSKAIALLEPITKLNPRDDDAKEIQIIALDSMAVAKHGEGDAADEESINRRSLDLERSVYGDSNSRVAETLANLGTAEASFGRYGDAEKLYQESAAILDAYYGADNPETIQVKSFAGVMAIHNGDYATAEKLLRNVLPVQEKEFDNKPNPNIAFTHDALGQLAMAQRDFHMAEAQFKVGSEMLRALYGDLNLQTAQTLANLGDALVKEGRYSQAERVLLPAVKTLTQHPLPGNMNVGVAELRLGECLIGQKRYREALQPLIAAHDLLETGPPSFANKLRDSRQDLAQAYEALHEHGKATTYITEMGTTK